MAISKEKPTTAVGYVRVSTEKQALLDVDLQKQSERIRKACARKGLRLIRICGDVASGADPHGDTRREELGDAVRLARAEGAALVITEPTRLFRNVKAAQEFLKTLDVPVFSVRDGRFLGRRALMEAIRRGEDTVRAIRRGTAAALEKKKAEGEVYSDDVGRRKGMKASAKVRRDRAQTVVMQVVGILERDLAYRDLPHQALAELLNRNLVKTGWNLPWTAESVRKVRKKAEEHLQMIAEVEQDDEMHQGVELRDAAIVSPVEVPFPAADLPGDKAPELVPVASTQEQDDGEAEMKKLPNYGMF